MGILKAVAGAVTGGLADSWLEVVEPDNMTATTVCTRGVQVSNKRSSNKKGTENIISNGSVIHVGVNQMMLLVDGGKIIDYSAEPGYYEVYLSSTPSMFNGELKDSIKETFSRIKFGGQPSGSQQVYFINLQEIKGIKFGTRNALQYFDNFYNAELFVRCHGSYSIKITDPLKFFSEAVPRNAEHVDINDINDQYFDEFLSALQAAIGQMSVDGQRISALPSKSLELAKYMSNVLDADWNELRGMEIVSVGVASISYDEEQEAHQYAEPGRNAVRRYHPGGLCAVHRGRGHPGGRLQHRRCRQRLYGNGHGHERSRELYGCGFCHQCGTDADAATAAGSPGAQAQWATGHGPVSAVR